MNNIHSELYSSIPDILLHRVISGCKTVFYA